MTSDFGDIQMRTFSSRKNIYGWGVRSNAVKDFYVGWALRDQQFGVTGVPPQHFRHLACQ